MAQYFVMDCHSPLTAEHYTLEVSRQAKKRWYAGVSFSVTAEPEFQPPAEPIELRTVPEAEPPPYAYAELMWYPIPLMTRRLRQALESCGVDNLQFYETKLVNVEGRNPPERDHYVAFNIVGVVSAADMQKSKTNPQVQETKISVDFYSLAVDQSRASGLLLFRLAENISAVLAHESVRRSVESSGIDTLTWFEPKEWAG